MLLRSSGLILIGAAALVPSLVSCRGNGGESSEAAALFDEDRVIEVSIELSEEDWDTIRVQERSFAGVIGDLCGGPKESPFIHVPSTVTIDGTTLSNVGVRKKGFFGSMDDERPSLKFSFDEYDPEQYLHGLERLTLNNNKQDDSHVRQCLAYQKFTELGLAAPRCNFAHVVVNGRDLGIYTHVEEIKKPFIRRHFSDDEGQLYEGTLSDFTETGKNSLEQKTNHEVPYDRSDLDAVQAALEDRSEGLLKRLSKVIDMDGFITFWVAETVMSHWDGYANNQNNYYIYNDPKKNRFTFIPWGVDGAFSAAPTGFLDFGPESDVVYSKAILVNRGYDDPEIRELYLEEFERVVEGWDTEGMLEELDRMEALLEPFGERNLSSEIDQVRDFVRIHPEEIYAQYQNGVPNLQQDYNGCE